MNTKKPVIRSPLDLMPLHQKQALVAWLTTGGEHRIGITYAEAKKRLLEEFGVKASEGALCKFYGRRNRAISPSISTPPGVKVEASMSDDNKTIHIKITLPK